MKTQVKEIIVQAIIAVTVFIGCLLIASTLCN